MNGIRIFCDVARHQSFSLAAHEHGITQSAASQRVGQLEKRLGVVLFDRSVRPLALTPAGEAFMHGCHELLDRYERLERRVSGFNPQALGGIRIEAIYSARIDLLNQLKDQFESSHQQATVTLEYKHPDEVCQAVIDRRCDFGIISYPQRWKGVKVIPLPDEPMAVICAPNHPLAGHKRLSATRLHGQPMACFEPSLPAGRRIRQYLRDLGVSPEVRSVFDNIDTIKNAVAVTDQVAILPKRTVQREVAGGTLRVIELDPILVRPMGIIYRGRTRGGFRPVVQAFVDRLLEHVSTGEAPGRADTPRGHTPVGAAV